MAQQSTAYLRPCPVVPIVDATHARMAVCGLEEGRERGNVFRSADAHQVLTSLVGEQHETMAGRESSLRRHVTDR